MYSFNHIMGLLVYRKEITTKLWHNWSNICHCVDKIQKTKNILFRREEYIAGGILLRVSFKQLYAPFVEIRNKKG